MKDVIIRGIRVPAARAKWVLVLSGLSVICLVIGIAFSSSAVAERSTEKHFIAQYFLISAKVIWVVVLFVTLPKVILPLALILAPFFAAMFALSSELWTQWWFWPATVLCEIMGGYLMLKSGIARKEHTPSERATSLTRR